MRLVWIAVAVAGVALAAAGIVWTAWREARRTPVVVRYDVAVPGWPAGQPPLRIVQLTDTHAGLPDMPVARLAAIVAQANALEPDLVVLTGDYQGAKWFGQDYRNLDVVVRPFRALRSRLGTYAVRGNHDDAYWSPKVIPRYRVTYLQNSHADAGPIVVAGVDDLSEGTPDVAAALAGIPADKPVLLLMHEPASFPQVPARVALTLAGHTHGGQLRLPLLDWLTMDALTRRYARGLFVEDGRRLIVSSGVGTTALPLRLGVPPEIVVVTLHGEDHSTGRNSATDR